MTLRAVHFGKIFKRVVFVVVILRYDLTAPFDRPWTLDGLIRYVWVQYIICI